MDNQYGTLQIAIDGFSEILSELKREIPPKKLQPI